MASSSSDANAPHAEYVGPCNCGCLSLEAENHHIALFGWYRGGRRYIPILCARTQAELSFYMKERAQGLYK